MTAKEMFEKLGYKLDYKNKYQAVYKKPDEVNPYVLKELAMYYKITISFKWKCVYKKGSYITFEELKAINKQIEELGDHE